jgi:nucleoside phosphorylase
MDPSIVELPPPRKTRNDFHIAIICALPLEGDAIEDLFDHHYTTDGYTPHEWTREAAGDPNAYSFRTMGAHNIVLAYMPGMGKSHGAAVAAFCRSSFPKIKMALVVSICGGAPNTPEGREVRLGDVIVSSGVVQHDFVRRHGEGVLVPKDTLLDNLGRPSMEVRALLAQLVRQRRKRISDRLLEHLGVVVGKLGTESRYPMERGAGWLTEEAHEPAIHIGLVASGDQVMRSAEVRDRMFREKGVSAFKMESCGVWDTFSSCLVVKGVADYADSYKNKKWQTYAAATAASCAKALLEFWT